jgi:hypothetical protein
MKHLRSFASSLPRSLSLPRAPLSGLLERWLASPPEIRNREFAGTARAATIAGVCRRTMQRWIDSGFIASIRLGKKHWIYLPSMIDRFSQDAASKQRGDKA